MKKRMLWIVALAIFSGIGLRAHAAPVQSSGGPDWQTAAGSRMEFDVASIKQYKGPLFPGNRRYTNFPMGPGDTYTSNGGPPPMPGPTFLDALRKQAGLKLIPQLGSVDVIVIDHVEHPSEN